MKSKKVFGLLQPKLPSKKNVILKAIYDEDEAYGYNTLTFLVFESQVELQNTFQDKVPFSSKYWGFKKSNTEVGAYFYKDSVCNFYLYCFNYNWIKNNLAFETLSSDNQIKSFLDSQNGFITYQDIVPNAAEFSLEVYKNLKFAKFDP